MTVDHVSSINMSRVLQMLYTHGQICRPDISAALKMDRSTVSKMVSVLADRSLIQLLDKGDSTPRGGRKPVYLELNHHIGYVIGVELQTDYWVAVMVNLRGEVLHAITGELPPESSIQYTVEQIATAIQRYIQSMESLLLGMVVSVPGIVNPSRGEILRSNPLNIDQPINITTILSERFGVPVLVENDAKSCCWAELFRRRNATVDNFLCVLMEFRRTRMAGAQLKGIGVGLGIVIDGRVHYGPNYSAGEFQSVFCKSPHSTQFSISDADAQRISEDREIFERAFRELSVNVSLLINVFNLSEVVVVGDMLGKENTYGAILQQAIQENWPHDTPATCSVTFTGLGHDTVAFGAACMFIQRLFSVPRYDAQRENHMCGIDLLNTVYPVLG